MSCIGVAGDPSKTSVGLHESVELFACITLPWVSVCRRRAFARSTGQAWCSCSPLRKHLPSHSMLLGTPLPDQDCHRRTVRWPTHIVPCTSRCEHAGSACSVCISESAWWWQNHTHQLQSMHRLFQSFQLMIPGLSVHTTTCSSPSLGITLPFKSGLHQLNNLLVQGHVKGYECDVVFSNCQLL